MEFPAITFVGPEPDDREVLERLPVDLRGFLNNANGVIAYGGGLHIRGACFNPEWHSLRRVWMGEQALHARYAHVEPGDVPFAQDAVGDQWLLRAGSVLRLLAETGEVESMSVTFAEFVLAVGRDPAETLGLGPLMQFQADGGMLEPGHLLNVYPPFCAQESGNGVSLSAVPTAERLDFLADLARQLPDDGEFRVSFE